MLAHDPRRSNDRNEKIETTNLALLEAELRLRDGNEVDWAIVAAMADHCDNVAGSYEDRMRRRFSLTSLFARRGAGRESRKGK